MKGLINSVCVSCHVQLIRAVRKGPWCHVNYEGPDQPAHPGSLIRALSVRLCIPQYVLVPVSG